MAAAASAGARLATSYVPRPYRATTVPSAYELHVVKRLGCGYSRGTLASIRALGGITPWLNHQLNPASVPEAPIVASIDSWFSDLRRTPAQKAYSNQNGGKEAWQYGLDLQNWTLLRRVHSNRTVLETMVDFWTNHLHVSTEHDLAWAHQANYDQMIRRHALGKFDDLLVAASTHPAMSLYLDNWRSVKDAPNENQGRELLELHTVGVDAGYTEDMVKDSAVLLSGYSVDWGDTYDGFYDSANHTTGAVSVLGFTHANASSDGRAATEAYLRYLAHHPATARTLARRMAVRFVHDDPSADLVQHIASAFTASGTDIKATLRAMIAHPEFRASAGQKVFTPVDDMVATLRVLGVTPKAPTSEESFANAVNWVHGGLAPYSWPRPDGAPETNDEWTTAVRVTRSFEMHWNLAGAWWPTEAVTYVAPRYRIPAARIRFDQLVDHLSRSLLGRGSTARMLRSACIATGLTPASVITRTHEVATWKFPWLAAVFLDSPDHMSR